MKTPITTRSPPAGTGRYDAKVFRSLNGGQRPGGSPYPGMVGFLSMTAIAIAVLGGCVVGPDYIAPKQAFAPFHNNMDVKAANGDRANPPLDAWWTGFDDPTLVSVVQRALLQNLDLAAALARVQQSRAAAQAAGAQLLPSAELDASATAMHQSLQSPLGSIARQFPDYTRGQREYNVSAVASWEIDLAGGLRRTSAAARDELEAAEADQMGTRVTIAADAADAYLQIRGFQARLAVATDQIETDGHLLQLVNVRQRFGSASDREVAQADALLQQARTTVPTLRTALEAQLNRLDVLLGEQPGTSASELAEPGDIPSIPAVPAGDAPQEVLRRRPDMIAAERRLAASNERIGAALSDYYPKISLSGALGFDSLTTNHLFSAQSFQPAGTGALRWRLFDFGRVDAEVKQARGANAEALAEYRLAAFKAAEDVEDAFTSLSQTGLRVQDLGAEVASLTRARDLSQRAYEAGSIPLTDVLHADRQLLSARDDLDGTRADEARAAVRTFRALGGGWSASIVQTSSK